MVANEMVGEEVSEKVGEASETPGEAIKKIVPKHPK
jgi:hypothetical protein